jgi:cytoplasmic iron level regulating protein YaaA (DUF328/UPF0246 family)
MRIVLPPSETKRAGGQAGSQLEWSSLVLPELTATREQIAADLVTLSASSGAEKALGLGAKGAEWLEANLALLSSPVMPAIERYTGVVFDALGYDSMNEGARQRVAECVWLFSALFGPILADDLIPRYRLSFDSKLPGQSLKSRWGPRAQAIWAHDFTLDLRSEGYRALAPLTPGSGVFVRVVKDLSGGAAAGHANKATKGRFVRAVVDSGARFNSGDDVLAWADDHGFEMAPRTDAPGELLLAVID